MNHTNEGSKLYLYSITSVAILGGLLFGYDTAVISGAEKGLEAFFLTAPDFQYDKVMHGITSSSALIGCVLGGALSGIFASRLGRRNSLRLAAVLFFLSALGSYYPEFLFFEYGKANMNLLITFNLYRILGGIGVGLASAVCPMYIAEIAPSNIRGTLVSCNQFAIIFGMLVVYFVNYLILGDHQNPVILKDAAGTLSVSSESDMWTVTEGWRYMFGSEAFPAAFFGMLLFFVPKTPRYLVMIDQDQKAYSILKKVNGATKAQEILAEIKATSQEKTEKLFTYGAAVIVIGILLSVFQQAIGINAVLYYAPRIFENAGAEGGGMMQTVIMGIVNIVFTLIAIFTDDRNPFSFKAACNQRSTQSIDIRQRFFVFDRTIFAAPFVFNQKSCILCKFPTGTFKHILDIRNRTRISVFYGRVSAVLNRLYKMLRPCSVLCFLLLIICFAQHRFSSLFPTIFRIL